MNCKLCSAPASVFYEEERIFFICSSCSCGAVQLSPQFYISPGEERKRYLAHNNDVEDPRYKEFLKPITSRIPTDFPETAAGLDFGCGTGPVAAVELEKKGYSVKLYDPFFHPNHEVLKQQYDFIICCEVMEHFKEPLQEFELLSSLLLPGGKLYCKTSLFIPGMDFKNWYYKNDPTHIFLYTEESLHWIKDHLGFKSLVIEPKVIIFGK